MSVTDSCFLLLVKVQEASLEHVLDVLDIQTTTNTQTLFINGIGSLVKK